MLSELQSFLLGAGLNLVVAFIIVRLVYYPVAREKSFVFSFMAFSAVIYFVLRFLSSVELSIGFGFGLFAIFSVLRYRTDEMPIREMTYLFTIIGLSVMNSFLASSDDLVKLLIGNGVVIALLFGLEREWGFRFEASLRLTYERIELITPANRDLMLADLRKRTGLPVKRVEVSQVDFLKDTAGVRVFYDRAAALQHAPAEEPLLGTSARGHALEKPGPGGATEPPTRDGLTTREPRPADRTSGREIASPESGRG